MINFREISGLDNIVDNIVVKITFGFALVMLVVISIILWLVGSGGGNK